MKCRRVSASSGRSHEDLVGGYLFNVRTLVAAEVFSDFLEMAQHLLDNGYKDPAASLTGAVLEDGLRRVCTKHTISTTGDLSSQNTKLGDASVYNRLMQKRVAVWIAVRNHADHGQFSEYTEADVRQMLSGVTELLSAHLG